MFEPRVETGLEDLKRIQQFTGTPNTEAELQRDGYVEWRKSIDVNATGADSTAMPELTVAVLFALLVIGLSISSALIRLRKTRRYRCSCHSC
jgi:hypothetical protein